MVFSFFSLGTEKERERETTQRKALARAFLFRI